MIPCGITVNDIADAISAHDDKELMARIWTRLQFEWFRVCSEISWDFLRSRPVTLDFATATATGLWLPSDLIGVDQVWDNTNEVEFFETAEAAAQADEWGYRFYLYEPSRTSLFDGTDLVLSNGGSTFTSASLTSAGTTTTDEYVQFGEEPGFYKISNTATPFSFSPTYYGPRLSNTKFSIRPWRSTKKMVLVDIDEDALLDRSVSVYYWRHPTPLYKPEDGIPMHMSQLLKLRVLRGIHEAKDRYPISERMLEAALKEAVKGNRRFVGVQSPRDKHGKRFDMTKSPYKQR